MSDKPKVLFLCTGNSCRSQMAEGWARHLRAGDFEPFSAGVQLHGLNRLAVRAMHEAGVDVSGHYSKKLDDLAGTKVDLVVTVCDNARESCPLFPGATRTIHHSFDDPPWLARDAADDEEALVHYRRVRDQIRDFVSSLRLV